ncbi:MAG TPA: glutamine amidotransferase [Lacipirellulaceae bacterium]|nr:glutamine amidotransferase [Lacipirellulaceae bacterium]
MNFEIRLQPVVSIPVVVIVTVVLLGLLFVRPRHVQLSGYQWSALIGLRLVVVLLMLFAMLRPSFVYTKTEPVAASLVMLIDDSRSMQVADSLGDKPRWETVKHLLQSAASDISRLNKRLKVAAYEFDRDTRKLRVQNGEISLPAMAQGDESAIGSAISDALARETNKRVLATLLLSDGAQRALAPRDTPPQVAVRRLAADNIPLFTFTFGKSGGRERADLSLDDLVTNETIFAKTPTEVRAQLTANGYANQRVKVQLFWESAKGMEVVDTQLVDTGVEGGSVPVALHYTPLTPGEYKVTLRVEPREGELVTTNNEVSTFVTVRAGGINVLYLVGAQRIAGEPGPEQRFVRAALARSPDIVVQRKLIDYNPMGVDIVDLIKRPSTASTGPRTGSAPDVIVLDDVDVQGLNLASWQAMADRVRHGTGLIMLGGYHSFGPGGFRDSPLADVLPLRFGPAQRQSFGDRLREDVQIPGPLHMQPTTPIGVQHPIMKLEGTGAAANRSGGADLWSKLPPLDGANLIAQSELKPNAQVLAIADDAQHHPLLVAGEAGDGRVLAFAGDSTWHWQMGGFGDAHRRFWRQCILWLAKKDEQTQGRVWIRLAGRRVTRGGRVEFNVGAENPQGEPIASAQFHISVQTPDGRTETVPAIRVGSDWLATFRQTTKPGDYRITTTANDTNREIGKAEARFLVPNADLELDRPAAEPTLMTQLAEATKAAGGAALAPEELPALLKRLAEKPTEVKQDVIAKVTYWDTWPYFLVFVGLLGTEWFLRKRWGLV